MRAASSSAHHPSRRIFFAATVLGALSPVSASAEEPGVADVSAADIKWFHSCQSFWSTCEAGAPAILPPGSDATKLYQPAYAAFERRLQPILCAFFLHAAFGPGRYTFRAPLEGYPGFEVTAEDVRVLQITSWRGSAIDCKRPYGSYAHFEIDMARALGIPVTNVDGTDEIGPVAEAIMDETHRRTQFVLQAYLENARLAPGRWFIPYDGWDNVHPRCVPVSRAKVAAYRAAMAKIAVRSLFETQVELVTPRLKASDALFAVN